MTTLTIRPLEVVGFGHGYGIWDEEAQDWRYRNWYETYGQAVRELNKLGEPILPILPEGFQVLFGSAREGFAGADDFADGVGPLYGEMDLLDSDGAMVLADRAGLSVLGTTPSGDMYQWTRAWPVRRGEGPLVALAERALLAEATLAHLRRLDLSTSALFTVLKDTLGFEQIV